MLYIYRVNRNVLQWVRVNSMQRIPCCGYEFFFFFSCTVSRIKFLPQVEMASGELDGVISIIFSRSLSLLPLSAFHSRRSLISFPKGHIKNFLPLAPPYGRSSWGSANHEAPVYAQPIAFLPAIKEGRKEEDGTLTTTTPSSCPSSFCCCCSPNLKGRDHHHQ